MGVFHSVVEICVFVSTPIEEGILPSRVPVQVEVHLHLALRLESLHELLREEDGRVQLPVGLQPAPVQVHAQQAASVVAVDDSIGV